MWGEVRGVAGEVNVRQAVEEGTPNTGARQTPGRAIRTMDSSLLGAGCSRKRKLCIQWTMSDVEVR